MDESHLIDSKGLPVCTPFLSSFKSVKSVVVFFKHGLGLSKEIAGSELSVKGLMDHYIV